MHDWTVDCRTQGSGDTRSHDMAYLKTLDIGYGYTADGGATFPFRGKGVGQMPELKEVLTALPQGRFLVNYKSNEEREATCWPGSSPTTPSGAGPYGAHMAGMRPPSGQPS